MSQFLPFLASAGIPGILNLQSNVCHTSQRPRNFANKANKANTKRSGKCLLNVPYIVTLCFRPFNKHRGGGGIAPQNCTIVSQCESISFSAFGTPPPGESSRRTYAASADCGALHPCLPIAPLTAHSHSTSAPKSQRSLILMLAPATRLERGVPFPQVQGSQGQRISSG